MRPNTLHVLAASLALLAGGATQAALSPDIVVNLEQPKPGSTYTGIATVRGWAVSPEGMDRVELYVDGSPRRELPMGDGRLDVCSHPAYPESLYPGSCNSGFAGAFFYGNLPAGAHNIRVVAYDAVGDHNEAEADFQTVRFDVAYLPDPSRLDLSMATAIDIVDGNTLLVRGVEVDGVATDVVLAWRTDSQDFDIQGISYQGSAVPYDFEALTTNQLLGGQDGWIDQAGQGQAYVRLDEAVENGTRVATHLRTTAVSESAFLMRPNDAQYSFPAILPGQSQLVMQFDLTGDYTATFALGRDLNGNGFLEADPFANGSGGEIGPVFGIHAGQLLIQEAAFGSSHSQALPLGNAVADWYQIRLVADLSANGGSGAGSLSYRNLSRGDLAFQPLPGMSGIDLGLDGLHPDAQPADWNAMWIHLLSGGGNSPSIDHLVPNGNPVP